MFQALEAWNQRTCACSYCGAGIQVFADDRVSRFLRRQYAPAFRANHKLPAVQKSGIGARAHGSHLHTAAMPGARRGISLQAGAEPPVPGEMRLPKVSRSGIGELRRNVSMACWLPLPAVFVSAKVIGIVDSSFLFGAPSESARRYCGAGPVPRPKSPGPGSPSPAQTPLDLPPSGPG